MKKLLILVAEKIHRWGNKHPDSILWILAMPLFFVVLACALLQLLWDGIWTKIQSFEDWVKSK